MNFNTELNQKINHIEMVLKTYLPKEEGYQKTVLEAMNYSVMAGGKRLRPMLMEETYTMLGGNQPQIIEPFMAALEMIHTYSLVHDDLPAIDNDEYRRGRKTTWLTYGEDMGILTGDALLNYAFETALKAGDFADDFTTLKQVMAAYKILTSKPGIYGMIGGQVVDVEKSGHSMTRDMLDFVYEMKTGALIECAMMIGAILAGAHEETVKIVEKIGSQVGLAFQIEDDILDVTSSLEVLGKQTHSDEKNEKTTYVTLMGIDKAKETVVSLSQSAVSMIDQLGGQESFLKELVVYLIHRKN